eukprot:16957-Alexandrium_andersonii.AAC.1
MAGLDDELDDDIDEAASGDVVPFAFALDDGTVDPDAPTIQRMQVDSPQAGGEPGKKCAVCPDPVYGHA